jgi:hypothetical protein
VEINGVDHYHMMRILNEATLAAAAELRCVAADPAGDVEWADEDFYDFYHNTPRGARKLGAYLYTRLKDLDFAAPRPAPEPE